jgi:hypothetical protein
MTKEGWKEEWRRKGRKERRGLEGEKRSRAGSMGGGIEKRGQEKEWKREGRRRSGERKV